MVKVFLEFKNGLGFYLPCLDHEIPKTTEFFEECEPESVRIRVSLSIYTKGLGFELTTKFVKLQIRKKTIKDYFSSS